MKKTSILFLGVFIAWMGLPFILLFLYKIDYEHGLVWLLIHQAYYAPFNYLFGHPFFLSDNDIGFEVTGLGRILAALFYAGIMIGLRFFYIRVVKMFRTD